MAYTDSVSRIEKVIAGAEPKFRKAFLGLILRIKEQTTLEAIARLLERGSFEEAFGNILLASEALSVPWNATFITAGSSTAFFVESALASFGFPPINVVFNQLNEGAIRVMRENQLRMVREFTQQQVEATRYALLRGIQVGANPIQQARNFRNSIGLTQKQIEAVENYREALMSGSSTALERQLRDRRFDPTVRRALRGGKPLTSTEVNRMVERYRQRFINFRAQTIARTEALRAANAGNYQMFAQAIENGTLDPNQVHQTWNTAEDKRVRNFKNSSTSHVSMNQQERMFGLPFTSGSGSSLLYPGDPAAPAKDTIRCRCTVGTRILSPNAVLTRV